MWARFKGLLNADIRYIAGNPKLLAAILTPLILAIFLKLTILLISGFVSVKTDMLISNYFTLTEIIIISAIPAVFGVIHAFMFFDEYNLDVAHFSIATPIRNLFSLAIRMIRSGFLSFIIVLLTIIITNPVPTEGWLRTTFVTILLSSQTGFVFIFTGSLAADKARGRTLSKLYGIFLAAIPFGLLFHHPWNYFAFFSPLYWISCAWITSVPAESLVYGTISIIITFGCILVLFYHFQNKKYN